MSDRRASRLIAIVAGNDAQILDIAGPLEIFSRCARIANATTRRISPAYEVVILTANSGSSNVSTTAGFDFRATSSFDRFARRIDTMLVVGGVQFEESKFDSSFLPWLRRESRRCRRTASICTGAFALAAAGILDRKRATTHWAYADRLATLFPNVAVDSDPIFVRDGNVSTSAGITAGMDLALSLVEEDHGPRIALRIARDLVLYLRRPGSQSQFSAPLASQLSDRLSIRELQVWLPVHIGADLSIDKLARHAGMSVRNFSRVFAKDIGMTPGSYVDRLRVDAACVRLADSTQSVARIAAECGLHSADVLCRTMRRVMQITPEDYRARFGAGSTDRD